MLTIAVSALVVRAPGAVALPVGLPDKPADGQGGVRHEELRAFLGNYCVDCHSGAEAERDFRLDELLDLPIAEGTADWERLVRKLASRQMPPPSAMQPEAQSVSRALQQMTAELDRLAAIQPQPGRTESLRRLTRTEYANAVRDLLNIPVDVTELLPRDEVSHGFDNVTVTELSPTLLERYITAAETISRQALGLTADQPESRTYRIPPDVTQDKTHVPGLPLGTRGGLLQPHFFPREGIYEISVRLMRDRNDEIEGLRGRHQMQILVDRAVAGDFTIKRPQGRGDRDVDANLRVTAKVAAGTHDIGVTFVSQPWSLEETTRQPLDVHYNFYRHPRLGPAVYQVTVTGPVGENDAEHTHPPSRLLAGQSPNPDEAEASARERLRPIMRQAYRRPIDEMDFREPLRFFREGYRQSEDFQGGMQRALAAVLVNPAFLFRIERDPEPIPSGKTDPVYRISDIELASRLSFFLWSSLPDDELLTLAENNELHKPATLEKQVRRMLADSRARSLVTNFAGQWLYLRNLDGVRPDARLFPNFGDNLRQAFRRETELLLASILENDDSVLRLLDGRHTFLNERLARHYKIPHVYGSRFRQVALAEDDHRGGILRHGSLLSVTSYATRTSPVLRGTWILENILGTPPPPPPPDIPDLEDNTVDAALPVRARLEEHRRNPACASCHDLIDPIGFSLENYDAIGRYRRTEAGMSVDAGGKLPGTAEFDGVAGLEQGLLQHPELFARTLTEKLMTYALGRGTEPFDAPAVREIVRSAGEADYRFSAFIVGIARSVPFQMRTRPGKDLNVAGGSR